MLTFTERACMLNSTADEREPESSDRPEANQHALQAWRVPACHPVALSRGAAAAIDQFGLKPLANAPAWIVWTRLRQPDHRSHGSSLTGFEGWHEAQLLSRQ
jgi:hypothetical protein